MLPTASNIESKISDLISKYIPGFGGYSDAESRRRDDRKAREFLSQRLQECKRDLQTYVAAALDRSDFDVIVQGESLREIIDHLQMKTLAAFEGYSSWFDQNQIDAQKLQSIVELDSDLIGVVDRLHQQILRSENPLSGPAEPTVPLNFAKAKEWLAMYRDRFAKRDQLLRR